MMFLISLFLIILLIVYFVQMKNTLVTVYEASDNDITDSQHVYWLLKNSRLHPKYSIPVDWGSMMKFRKGSDNVVISVQEKNAGKARELIMNYRLEKRKIERNIENERRKSERLFLDNR